MQNYLDFDAFLREAEKTMMKIRVLGKEYEVKPELPALIPMKLARAQEGMSEEETVRMYLQSADAIFGKEAIDEMCEKGLTTPELAELVKQTVALIRGEKPTKNDGEVLMDDVGHVAMRKAPGKK